MNVLYLTWIASVEHGSIEWKLIDRENLQLSVVYFLQCQETKKVKIGISQNFNKRFKEIQSMSPTKLRLHGEWFLIPEGMDGLIVDLGSKAGELQSQSPFEKEKIFLREALYSDCPF